jgi:hypothetical protein
MLLFLFIPLFIIAAVFAFYIPGRVVLGKQLNLSKLGIFATSCILGIVLWGWQGYIFGFLQVRWVSYLYLLLFLAIYLKKRYFHLESIKIKFKKIDFITILLVSIGIFGQIMPFVKTGLTSSKGLFMSSYNYCDHVWHAALAQELAIKFPPSEPGLSGVALTNYNFWFHLVVGEFSRVFHLPLLSAQFSGLYIIAPILLAMIGYVFAVIVHNSKSFIRIFLFFLFFSGDAIGWLFSIVNRSLTLNMSQGISDAIKFMDTPGYGLSLIIALAAFYIFLVAKNHFSRKTILIIGLLVGSLIGFKIYMGIGFLLGFGSLSLFGLMKKNFSYLWIFIFAVFFSVIQFFPFNGNSGGLFFLLLETPRSFIAQKGLNLGQIDQRWSIYFHHRNYFRLAEYGVLISSLYLFAQFGIKVFGFFPLRKSLKILGIDFFVLLYSILLSSLIMGMFFYQRVGGGNIWQFLLPVSLILTVFISLNLTIIFSKLSKIVITILIILITLFTIPSWVNLAVGVFYADYSSSFHGISNAELESYNFLKNHTSKDSELLIIDQPSLGGCPIASIAKVLTERRLFFSGTGVSGAIPPEYIRRERNVTFIKSNNDDKKVIEVLKNDNIDYIIIYNSSPIATSSPLLKNIFLEKVFSNELTNILKVK